MNRNMKSCMTLVAGCLLAFSLTGCVAGLPKSGSAIVEVVEEPLIVGGDAEKVKLLESEACNYNVLGIVSVGDASIETAAQKANIKHVVEMKRNLMGLNFWYLKIAKNCTVVKGTN